MDRAGERLGQRGFPDPRDVFDQKMPPRQKGGDRHLHDVGFPSDDLFDVLFQKGDFLGGFHDKKV
jgi:hypothetical protein